MGLLVHSRAPYRPCHAPFPQLPLAEPEVRLVGILLYLSKGHPVGLLPHAGLGVALLHLPHSGNGRHSTLLNLWNGAG